MEFYSFYNRLEEENKEENQMDQTEERMLEPEEEPSPKDPIQVEMSEEEPSEPSISEELKLENENEDVVGLNAAEDDSSDLPGPITRPREERPRF